MKITNVSPFILHVPVTGGQISDSTNTLSHWGIVGACIEAEGGLRGYGFTGTHAHLPGDQLIAGCIEQCMAPLLLGQDARDTNSLWHKISRFAPLQWVGRSGVVTMSHAAIDIALWDLKAKAAQQPLWKVLGGQVHERVRAYNTDIGWLSVPDQQLVEGALRAVDQGFTGIKIKVGSTVERDLHRLAAVRKAIGPHVTLAIDGNGKWDLATCRRFCHGARDEDVFWFEEPLWHDDVKGHAQLARNTSIPIALGEQLYSVDAFAEFVAQEAIHWVQPDVTRMAGLTEVLRVCELAASFRLPVAPHVGDMGQVHVHLAFAHPACAVLEYIPWIRACFVEPVDVVEGHYRLPEVPGAGTTPADTAWERYRRPTR